MNLVPVICTQCGAQIEVDDISKAGVCQYCGTKFVANTENIDDVSDSVMPEKITVKIGDSKVKIIGRRKVKFAKLGSFFSLEVK